MKHLKLALLAVLLAASAAGPLLAAPRGCADGSAPKLSGDLFSPVECSSTTKAAVMLPDLPVAPSKKAALKDLDGRWEGDLAHALGRYHLQLKVTTSWSGKCDLTLDLKELQFHDRLSDRLLLVPSKQNGAYEATLTASLAPDASLKGGALLGLAAEPEVSTATAKRPAERQLDLLFENGAAHRVFFELKGKDALRVRAFSAVPSAPLQTFELTLTRVKI